MQNESAEKDEKTLYKLMNNAASGKTMKSSRNILEVNWKRQHKLESNPNYMSEKMFDNDLVKICRSQVLKNQHILKFIFEFDIW